MGRAIAAGVGDLDRHLLVFGKLKLPPGGVARWRELATDPEAIADWPELLEGGHPPAGSVGDALDAFVALDGANGDLGLRVKGATVTLAGFLLESGTLTWSRDVATALARASEVGAKGEVVFLRVTGEGGVRLVVEPAGASFEVIEPDDALALLESPRVYQALGEYESAAGTSSVAIPPEQEVPPEIREAIAAGVAALPEPPQVDLESPMGVALAFDALTLQRAKAAPKIALAVLRAGYDGTLATMAAAALHGSGNPEALNTLLAYAAPPEGPAPLLRADLPNTFGKPLLYEVLASLRAAGTTEQVAARFDQLVARADRDGDNALARLTGALLQRGALDPARATAVADRLPDQFGALRPAG